MICEIKYNEGWSRLSINSKYKGTNGITDTYQCIFSNGRSSALCFDYYINAGEQNDVIHAFLGFVDDVIDCLNGTEEIVDEQRLRLSTFQLAFGTKNALEKAIMLQNVLNGKTEKDFVPMSYLARNL